MPGSGEAGARTLTLVTGDTVTATRGADGTLNTLLRGPDGLFAGYDTSRVGQSTCLYPHSAVSYVAAGLLDRELFNVTRLLADGYDDAQRDRLPPIVTYQDTGQARTLPAPGGARRLRALDSMRGAAPAAERSGAFWTSVTGDAARSGAKAPGVRPSPAGGITEIRLDGKVKASPAYSTGQTGAPRAGCTLRATVRDAAGNSADQQSTRAFGLK
ncbi:hypothetical protein [Streptomyces sp. NPDC059979]|uniref:hypothetical protein n=1 Tax=Streptomyces sp. NPDC059979 TaxID=3347021 RepID=UPI0036903A87